MHRPRRLGLFGGSFDPVHQGHLHAARAAAGAFGLDRVVFVPAARPPHKPERVLADGADRLAMLRLAIADEPRWCVSDLELRRPGPSYTVDTARVIAEEVGEPGAEVWLILGSDNLPGLAGWHDAVTLLRLVHPVVVLREGDPVELPEALVRALPEDVVARLEAGFLRVPPRRGRSTEVRAALRAGEDEAARDVPPAVREYIRRRGLYRAS